MKVLIRNDENLTQIYSLH